ncbi:leucine-rich repeat domain-containing protein [Wenzhouxiangella marina]|uniref:Uncharacterized protein n=1 Tax=Wenzhouxiangella marina TaxID=1579979 RepID=A0A0K0XZP9_9GAMM|nr:hypothetical protein [Wenzhouxiangella marina]AKS43159.1 hypothetical protein WM2015_2802 [Wenzhouxiangella marina]MBB6087156.1 hypothetical protein [Wenzhouxiangella marina]
MQKLIPTLLALAATLPLSTQAQVSAAERDVLIEFYQATNGDRWTKNYSWLGPVGTECDWYGVECQSHPDPAIEDEVVTRLRLESNNLSGELPTSLGGLPHLISLHLRANKITGTVPRTLLLTPLESIDLSLNRIRGFGDEVLPGPPSATVFLIDLSSNLLSWLPPDEWLAHVVHLDLSTNNLSYALAVERDWPMTMSTLRLADNRIHDVIPISLTDFPALQTLDLSQNTIASWPLDEADPPALTELDLSSNWLGPFWPEHLPLDSAASILRLASNGFTRPLPAWLSSLELQELDISNNDIPGDIAPAFSSLRFAEIGKVALFARNNRFTGELPSNVPWEYFDRAIYNHFLNLGLNGTAALDLCGNELSAPDSLPLETIDAVHRGGGFEACQATREPALDRTFSGSWFHPGTAGEGFSMMLTTDWELLVYWFGYGASGTGTPGPVWHLATASITDSGVHFNKFLTTSGRFGNGGDLLRKDSTRSIWLERAADESLLLTVEGWRPPFPPGIACPGVGHPLECWGAYISERVEPVQLTRLAGSTCDTQLDQQIYSGAWFNPWRSGEGFVIEVTTSGDGLVYWFTHEAQASGNQLWLIGQAPFEGSRLEIPEMLEPRGGQFWSEDNPEDVSFSDWGSLTIEFTDRDQGRISYESHDPDYGAGSYDIVQLARPRLADCY